MLFAARRLKAGYIGNLRRFGYQIMTRGAGDCGSIFVFGVAGVPKIVIPRRRPRVMREDQRLAGDRKSVV